MHYKITENNTRFHNGLKTDVRFDLALFFLSLTQRIGNSDILVISTGSKCTLISYDIQIENYEIRKKSSKNNLYIEQMNVKYNIFD